MTLPLVVEMTVDTGNSYELSAETNQHEINLDNELEINVVGYDVPEYEGSYTVDAGLSPVVLNTQDKRLTQNVTVNALTENQVTGNSLTINTLTGKVSSLVSISAGYSPSVFGVSKSLQLSTQERATITPTTSEQTAVTRGKYTTGAVKVRAMPTGTRGTPTATKGTVSNHSVSVTPSVTNTTGYIEGGTINGTAVSVSASELVSGNKAITQNGNNIDVANYSTVSVNVPTVTPTGTLPITQNGTYDVTNYASADVSVSGGVTPVEPKAVIFLDYDGTVVYSYTEAEANALSELPANPTHTGLTAQGWNWTLADIKRQILRAPGGYVEVGQNYVTNDGKTRIYIHIDSANYSFPFYLRFSATVVGGVTINWGDNSAEETNTATATTSYSHTYANAGDYVVTLQATSGKYVLGNTSGTGYSIFGENSTNNVINRNRIYKVEVGTNTTEIGLRCFDNCNLLATITIPTTITKFGERCFQNQGLFKGVNVPNVTFTYGSLWINATPNMSFLTQPKAHKTAYRGATKAMQRSTVNAEATGGFSGCTYIPKLVLPEGMVTIPNEFVRDCKALTELTVPSTVTTISSGNNFNGCNGILAFHFKPTSPPTLRSTNAFSSINSNCVFYVPRSENQTVLTAYQTASNWSTYSSRFQEEPQ